MKKTYKVINRTLWSNTHGLPLRFVHASPSNEPGRVWFTFWDWENDTCFTYAAGTDLPADFDFEADDLNHIVWNEMP